MAINIFDLFKNQLLGDLAKSASGFLGENESTTKGVLETVAPSILGSLVQKGSTESGASSILDLLKNNSFDSDLLGNVSSLATGGESKFSGLLNMGGPIIKMLFGDKLGSIVDWISSNKGMKSSSVTSLFSFVAPFLMGLIGKQVKSQNLGVSGLMSLLGGQSSFIKSLLPSGLSNVMNFSAPSVNTKVESTSYETKKSGFGKFWPWLLLLLALLLLWFALKGCNGCKKDQMANEVTTAIDSTASAVTDAVDSLSTATTNAVKGSLDAAGNWVRDLGKEISLVLPDKTELKVGENSVENRLVEFIKAGKNDTATLKNTWFTFDRLYFETGKSTLTAESQNQLKNVAAIMKAFPNVNIKLGGYTDADGDETKNMKLSDSRAKSAKFELQKLGVNSSRMTSEGYGEQYPVCAANDTPECKAQNRRIDIRVTKM